MMKFIASPRSRLRRWRPFSSLVKKLLIKIVSIESPAERLKREERTLREQISAFSAGDKKSRDDLHERGTKQRAFS